MVLSGGPATLPVPRCSKQPVGKRVIFCLWLWLGLSGSLRAADPDWDKLALACKFTAWNYDLKADGETNTFYVYPKPIDAGQGLWVFWKESDRVLIVRSVAGVDARQNPVLEQIRSYKIGPTATENELALFRDVSFLQKIASESVAIGRKVEVVNPSLSKMVLAATNGFDLTAPMAAEGLSIPLPPSAVLGWLVRIAAAKPGHETAWQALRRIVARGAADPVLKLQMGQEFLVALDKAPLLFYNRYMGGDAHAWPPMAMALAWDPESAPPSAPDAPLASPTPDRCKAILKASLNKVHESREWIKDAGRIELHKQFAAAFEAGFAAWCKRRGESVSDY